MDNLVLYEQKLVEKIHEFSLRHIILSMTMKNTYIDTRETQKQKFNQVLAKNNKVLKYTWHSEFKNKVRTFVHVGW